LSPLAHSAAQYCLWNLGLFRNPAQDRTHQHSGTWGHSEIRPKAEQSIHSGTWGHSEIRPRTEHISILELGVIPKSGPRQNKVELGVISLWNLGTFRNPAQDRTHQHSGTWDHSEIRPRTEQSIWNLGSFRNPAQGRTKYSLWNLGTFRNPAQDRTHQHSGTWDHSEIRPRTEQSTHSGTWDYSEIRPRTELMQPPLTLQLTHS
jgi:hypothetical protein